MQPGAERAGVSPQRGELDIGAPLELRDIGLRNAQAVGDLGLRKPRTQAGRSECRAFRRRLAVPTLDPAAPQC